MKIFCAVSSKVIEPSLSWPRQTANNQQSIAALFCDLLAVFLFFENFGFAKCRAIFSIKLQLISECSPSPNLWRFPHFPLPSLSHPFVSLSWQSLAICATFALVDDLSPQLGKGS